MKRGRIFTAGDARQGEIVLRHHWSRGVFAAALAGLVVTVLATAVALAV